MMKENHKLKELKQQMIRGKEILQENERSFEQNKKSKYSSEQVEEAQKESAKKEINSFYDSIVNPAIAGILYLLYYIATLVAFPMIYYGYMKLVLLIFFVGLIIIIISITVIERTLKKRFIREEKWVQYLGKFTNDTTVFNLTLTSLGYLIQEIDKVIFFALYAVMILALAIALWFDIIRPIYKEKHSIAL